jgi:hypothetical protein
MRLLLASLALIFNGLDNLTTWIALTTPTTHGVMEEANPVVRWMFEQMGMEWTLGLEMWVMMLVIVWIARTRHMSWTLSVVTLSFLAFLPAFAVWNNLNQMIAAGMF